MLTLARVRCPRAWTSWRCARRALGPTRLLPCQLCVLQVSYRSQSRSHHAASGCACMLICLPARSHVITRHLSPSQPPSAVSWCSLVLLRELVSFDCLRGCRGPADSQGHSPRSCQLRLDLVLLVSSDSNAGAACAAQPRREIVDRSHGWDQQYTLDTAHLAST